MFKEIFCFDCESKIVSEHTFGAGQVQPSARNSAAMVTDGVNTGYLFGGADLSGPRNDLYRVSLKELEFK